MPAELPKELFSHDSGRNSFNGILIARQRGDFFLLPIHEIVWVAATPLAGQGGCVEIHTRHRLIRLGLSRMDASRKLVDLLFAGSVSRITEGTAPPQADHDDYQRESPQNQSRFLPTTLVVEILNIEESSIETGESSSPPLLATEPELVRTPGLGFPSR